MRLAAAEPVAFLGGVFAGILRLDLDEEPLKGWVKSTAQASGLDLSFNPFAVPAAVAPPQAPPQAPPPAEATESMQSARFVTPRVAPPAAPTRRRFDSPS